MNALVLKLAFFVAACFLRGCVESWFEFRLAKKLPRRLARDFTVFQDLIEIRGNKYCVRLCIPKGWTKSTQDFFKVNARYYFAKNFNLSRGDTIISYKFEDKNEVPEPSDKDESEREYSIIKNYDGHELYFKEITYKGDFIECEGFLSVKGQHGVYLNFIFIINSDNIKFINKNIHAFQRLMASVSLKPIKSDKDMYYLEDKYLDFLDKNSKMFYKSKIFIK